MIERQIHLSSGGGLTYERVSPQDDARNTSSRSPPDAVAFIVRPYSLYSIIGKLGCSIAVYSFSSLPSVFFFLSRLSINVLPLKKSTSIINIAAPMHIALSATLKTGKSISLK